ncbi:MAG: hypothetical protein KAG20_02900 [Cocleimonas sp.]|nr:hypothetical protein [Cocleimonas sp.]
MDVQDKFSITSINLREPQIRILTFLISSYLNDKFSFKEQKNAAVQVVELQSKDETKKLNDYKKKYPNSYFIVFSDYKIKDKNVSVVNYPISPKKLLDALNVALSKVPLLLAKEKKIYKKIETDNSIDFKRRDFKKKGVKKDSKKKKLIVKEKVDEYDFYSDLDEYVENTYPNQLNNEADLTPSDMDSSKKDDDFTALFFKNPKEKMTDNKDKLIDINKDKLSFMSSRPDVDIDDAILMSQVSYRCDDYLQGHLAALLNNKKSNAITTPYCSIIYNAEHHTAYINVNNRTLQNIATIASLKIEYPLVDIDSLIKDKKVQWEDADTVLWKISIWASRGRLPLLLNDIDRQFTLLCWPNLTRFMMTPHAMEISALWLDKPISLRESLVLLDIPQRYVFSFYSAVVALELLSFEKDKAVIVSPKQKKQPIKTEAKRTGVFSKLLRFFKPNNIEDI